MKRLCKTSQFALFALLVITILAFGVMNHDILSVASLYSLARTCTVPAIFALAIMVVMVIGELDMSYCMIGAFSSYAVFFALHEKSITKFPLLVIFLTAVGISIVLQLLNWFLIDRLHILSFIATLGTQTFLKGAILAFVGSSYIYDIPKSAVDFGTTYLLSASYKSGVATQLPLAVIIMVVMYVLMNLILEHTVFGRKLYAIGGDPDAAKRAGINVSQTRLIAFIIVGVICGIGGVVHNCLGRCSLPMPTDLVGQELNGIAAVVLGRGASQRAKGTVSGTLIGVLLLQFISNNLIMIGVPSYYQGFVTGLIIFVGLVTQTQIGSTLFSKILGKKGAVQ